LQLLKGSRRRARKEQWTVSEDTTGLIWTLSKSPGKKEIVRYGRKNTERIIF
jgi:hypothetical protein